MSLWSSEEMKFETRRLKNSFRLNNILCSSLSQPNRFLHPPLLLFAHVIQIHPTNYILEHVLYLLDMMFGAWLKSSRRQAEDHIRNKSRDVSEKHSPAYDRRHNHTLRSVSCRISWFISSTRRWLFIHRFGSSATAVILVVFYHWHIHRLRKVEGNG